MRDALEQDLQRLVQAHRGGQPLLLLFDYDGTLAPIQPRPELATLPPETRRALEQLSAVRETHVGVISGRKLDDVRGMVGLPALYYCGNAGLEMDLRGRHLVPPEAEEARQLVGQIIDSLTEIAAGHEGAWIENKELGLTLHYRAVDPARHAELHDRAVDALRPTRDRLRVLEGPMALEVMPAVGWTKGTALRRLAGQIGGSSLPLYAGDAENDADALEAAVDLGGVALGVGPHAPPQAQHHLPEPADLTRVLEQFHQALLQG